MGAGVVDSDYRGLLGVLLFNLGQEDFECTYALRLNGTDARSQGGRPHCSARNREDLYARGGGSGCRYLQRRNLLTV